MGQCRCTLGGVRAAQKTRSWRKVLPALRLKLCLVDSLGKVVSRMRSIKLLGEMGSKATRECVTGMINPAVWERDLH